MNLILLKCHQLNVLCKHVLTCMRCIFCAFSCKRTFVRTRCQMCLGAYALDGFFRHALSGAIMLGCVRFVRHAFVRHAFVRLAFVRHALSGAIMLGCVRFVRHAFETFHARSAQLLPRPPQIFFIFQ